MYDEVSKSWLYPFIMAGINTKVVRRSNAIAGYPYGKNFRYEESSMAGDGEDGKQKAMTAAAMLGAMMAKPGTEAKKAADSQMPKPGEGPSKSERDAGFYDLRFYTTLNDGGMIVAKVYGDKDPGYGSTSKILAECGLCLVKDSTPKLGGVLTPSVAMGDALLSRLQSNAGLTFSIES